MRLGFSNLLGKLLKYVATYTKGTLKKDQSKTCLIKTCLIIFKQFFFIFFIKAYVVGTHLNFIDKLMQFI